MIRLGVMLWILSIWFWKQNDDSQIIVVTARDGCCLDDCRKWLVKYLHNGDSLPLYIRPKGNTEKDYVIKERIYREHIEPFYDVQAVFDDRPQVIRMWRKLGIPVFNCGDEYDF